MSKTELERQLIDHQASEIKEQKMVLEVLVAAGFVTQSKVDEAFEFVKQFRKR